MTILKLVAQLGLDGTRFKAGLREASVAGKGWAKDLGGSIKGELAQVFGAAAMVAFVKSSLETVGALKDIAEQSQMTTDEVQKFEAALERMGLGLNDLQAAERNMGKFRREAVESSQAFRDLAAQYGITLKELNNPNIRNIDLLMRVMDRIRNTNLSAGDRARLGDMFGDKVGPKLGEMGKELAASEGMKLISAETFEAVDKAEARWISLKKRIRAEFIKDMFLEDRRNKGRGLDGSMLGGLGNAALAASGQDGMYKDKIAEEHRKTIAKDMLDLAKARRDLEKEIFELSLKQMNAADARVAQERKLSEILAEKKMWDTFSKLGIPGFEMLSIDASKRGLSILSDLLSGKADKLSVSSLTSTGQFASGRNAVLSDESKFVRIAKEQLGVQRAIEKNTAKGASTNKAVTVKP